MSETPGLSTNVRRFCQIHFRVKQHFVFVTLMDRMLEYEEEEASLELFK